MIYTIESFLKRHGYFACSVLFLLLIVNPGCKQQKTEQAGEQKDEVAPDTLPDDFVAFYDKFHTDSAYQMEHITFPLEGLPSSSTINDSVPAKRFYWQRAEWKKHNPFTDPSHQYEQWYEVLNDRVIDHWIQVKGTNMFIHRRFAKLDHEWYLIYYAGLRPIQKEN